MTQTHFYFDLDGTVTNQELLPLISRQLGMYDEMNELTIQTMEGNIPFVESFERRVNLLKQIPLSRVQDIVNTVKISPYINQFLNQYPERCTIVTQNLDVWIVKLMQRIKVRYVSSEANFEGDALLGIKKIIKKENVVMDDMHHSVSIGDGFNDIQMLYRSNIAIAYAGVHKPVESLLTHCDYYFASDKTLCSFLERLL